MYSLIFRVLLVTVLYVSLVKCEEEKKMCPFLAACIKETDGKVKAEDVKVLMTAKEEDLDNISEDILCVSKCALEKRQVIVNEKIDMEKLSDEKMILHNVDKKDEFMECVKNIEAIKECGDVKEFMRCKLKFTKQ